MIPCYISREYVLRFSCRIQCDANGTSRMRIVDTDQRQRQIKRLKSLGATTAGPVDPVNESKGGGKPSDSYLGRLRARVKPNITFSDSQLQSVRGNPAAEVEVTCSPSGQIIGIKLTQSSGNAAWDQAVLKAIEKTGTLPRDENGKIPSKIPFVFRPRD